MSRLIASMGRRKSELSAVLIRGDGTRKDLGLISKSPTWCAALRTWLQRLLLLACAAAIVNGIMLGDPLAWLVAASGCTLGIVTTVGVNYMASDFASGGVTPTISGFKFHDSGVGTGGAVIGDTALGSPAGSARVTGTPSNPSANIYRSVAAIAYTTTLAITEWGLFSASTSGTLWDRRVFAAINVVNGDSIQFTYNLTVPSGGS